MSIRFIRVDVEELTPDLCRRFSAMPALDGERDIKESHLRFLDEKVSANEFYSPTWAVTTVKGAPERLRCDGQHSSTVLTKIVDSGNPERFPANLQAIILNYEIDSVENDAETLFNLFDNPKSARTNTDAMSVFRAAHPELKTFDNRYLVHVATGVNYYVEGLSAKIKKDHVKAVLKARKKRQEAPAPPPLPRIYDARQYGLYFLNPQFLDFTVWLKRWKDSRCAWILVKTGVVAQILESWLKAPVQAQRYWGYVFREDHPDPEHASRRLVLKLRALKSKPRPKAEEYFSLAEELWATYLLKEPEGDDDSDAPPVEEMPLFMPEPPSPSPQPPTLA